jgi:hypothetical protein
MTFKQRRLRRRAGDAVTLLRIVTWRLRTYAAVRLLRLSALIAKLAVPVAPWIFDGRRVPRRGG